MAELDQQELDAIVQKETVATFLTNPHTLQQSQELLSNLRNSEAKLASSVRAVLEIRTASSFRKESDAICLRARNIGEYHKDMDRMLIGDIQILTQAKKEEKVDVLSGFSALLAPPGLLLTVATAGIATNQLTPGRALVGGFAVGAIILVRKSIGSAFMQVGRSLCDIPKSIRGSMTIYYVKETAKENVQKIARVFDRFPRRNSLGMPTVAVKPANRNDIQL